MTEAGSAEEVKENGGNKIKTRKEGIYTRIVQGSLVAAEDVVGVLVTEVGHVG